jgi:hypothetical protein
MKHLKIFLITTAALFPALMVCAQAREASVMVDKENRNAVMIAVNQPEKITEDALQQRLQRSGLKEKPKNGAATYKGVIFSEISPSKVDIYTKVEPGPDNSSVVYMAVSRGYNNFTNGGSDSVLTENVKTFLNSFIQDANNHFADVGIAGQNNDIAQDEKDYQHLLDEQRSLQKKKSDIEVKLSDIQTQLNTKSETIARKKSGLEDARTKRKEMPNQ